MQTRVKSKILSQIFKSGLCLSFFITLFLSFASANNFEYAMFPSSDVKVSQIAYNNYSHSGKNVTDIVSKGSAFAPFSGTIRYVDETWGYVIFESDDKVYYADGTLDKMCVGFMHDNDISDLYIGKKIKQGQAFYQNGTKSPRNNVTGAHIHIIVMRGKYQSKFASSYSSRGNVYIYDAFFLSKNTTITKSGYSTSVWKIKDNFLDNIPRIAITTTKTNLYASAAETSTVKDTASKGTILYLDAKVNDDWYRTEDGLFVRAGDIKMEVENATISDEITKTITAIASTSDAYLKDKPYEAAAHINGGTIAKGKDVSIVGEVTNKWGNKWYIVEKDGKKYYIWSGDVQIIEHLFDISATFKVREADTVYSAPYNDATKTGSVKKNDTVTVKRFVLNSRGNIWVQLTNNNYLCFYENSTDSQKLTFIDTTKDTTVSNIPDGSTAGVPTGNRKASTGCPLRGKITTVAPILTLTTRVRNASLEILKKNPAPVTVYPLATTRTVTINASTKNRDGSSTNINNKMQFDTLSATGAYRYEIAVQLGFVHNGKEFKFGNEENVKTSVFTVGNTSQVFPSEATSKPTAAPTATPKPTNTPTPKPTATPTPKPTATPTATPSYPFTPLFDISAKFTTQTSGHSRVAPYSDAAKATLLEAGQTITVTRFVKNSYDNIWAQLTDGSYVCFYDLPTKSQKIDFVGTTSKIAVAGIPDGSVAGVPKGNLDIGDNCGLRGQITATAPMFSVTARIRDASLAVIKKPAAITLTPLDSVRTVKINSSVKNRDGSSTNINNTMKFGDLTTPGAYRYEVAVQLGFVYMGNDILLGSEQVVIESTFTVGKTEQVFPDVPVATSTPKPMATPTPKPTSTPTPTPTKVPTPTPTQVPTRLPGDVNDDGRVNMKDSIQLLKSLCGWNVTINSANAEVTGDGRVNMKDHILLLKYLCGWNVKLN